MKRFIAVAGAFFTLAAIFTPAYAASDRIDTHMIIVPVKFRTHFIGGVVGTNGYKLDQAGLGCIDSTYYQNQDATAAVPETTEAISLLNQAIPVIAAQSATVATDTLAVLGRFFLMPGPNNGVIDTAYIEKQFSPDAVNWTKFDSQVNTIGNICVNAVTGAAAAAPFFSLFVRSSAITNGLEPSLTQTSRLYPYIRFIVRGKQATGTAIQNFSAQWVTWSTSTETAHN